MALTSFEYPVLVIFAFKNIITYNNTIRILNFLGECYGITVTIQCIFTNLEILVAKKELNIIGESIDRSQVIDMDSHFKGQLTIHYLPDSSAKMNPFHFDQTCLGLDNNHLINMPVEFNTTSGIGYLQVQHTTPDNEIQYLNYTGHSLRRLFKKTILTCLSIKIIKSLTKEFSIWNTQ